MPLNASVNIRIRSKKGNQATPLRYPGGKSGLTNFFSEVIDSHGWGSQMLYVEPYAGGAGAALSLLLSGKVASLVINDYDSAVYSFWRLVVDKPSELVRRIKSAKLTMDEWRKQKIIYDQANSEDYVDLGFATFYLNRTNRSGILGAGPIGGKAQDGRWKLDERYNKDNLVRRIERITKFRDKISVHNKDGKEIIGEYSGREDAFLYVDPPYFNKGPGLYLNSFTINDHKDLAQTLRGVRNKKWILSYDCSIHIANLYKGFAKTLFSINYSTHPSIKSGEEIVIFSHAINTRLLAQFRPKERNDP